MVDFTIYLLYRAGTAAVGLLPLNVLFRIGSALGWLAWALLPRYRRLARRNVEIAFAGEMSAAAMRRLVRRHFQRLGANLLCTVKLSGMPLDTVAKCVVFENLELPRAEATAGHPVVLALGHLANWEAFAQLLPTLFPEVPKGTVYQKLRNRRIDRHIRDRRARAGVELFDRSAGFAAPIQLLRNRGGIGVLSDQHAGDHGLWTPFFGRLASTTTLPALLGKRTNASVLSATMQTVGVARWRMSFTPRLDARDDSVESLTAKINRVLEQQIRAAPEDWFWVHNRWKTPNPNFLLSRYKRGVFLPPEFRRESLKPFRIVIRASNWLGDAVMSVPAVRAIKRGRPDAHLTILTPDNLAPVWKLVDAVDEVIAIPRKSVVATARAIRQRARCDVAILFPNSLRVALETSLAGVPRRVGYRGHARAWLLNQIVRRPRQPGPPEHHSRSYLRIAEQLGAAVGNDTPPDKRGVQRPSGTSGERIRLGLCPGAEYGPAKRWLPERFAQAAAAVAAAAAVEWVLFGTKNDAQVGAQIATALGANCTNLIGQTTVEELIARLRECRLLLTNDTGTMHLATLLGVPVVAVFGSTEPRLTGPVGNSVRVIRHHVECSPCFLRECPIDFRCMHAVSASEVADAVLAML